MSIELYRYISVEDFVNLVINNKERYMRPSLWDDKYEGYLFTRIETREDIRQIVSTMYYELCPGNYYAISDNYFKMWHSKWFTYVQCWSRHPETDAMWRCYSYGDKAIRIRTRKDKLLAHAKKLFPDKSKFSISLKRVSYDLGEETAMKQTIDSMRKSPLVYKSYFHKRRVFKHEGEYRLLVEDVSSYYFNHLTSFDVKSEMKKINDMVDDEKIIDYLTDQIYTAREKLRMTTSEKDAVRLENAGNISDFLEGVMVHPLAESWYVDIVKEICQSKGIEFDGQSTIYKLK